MNLRKLVISSVLTVAVSGSVIGVAVGQEVSESHLSAARSVIAAIKATDPFDDILPAMALDLKGRLIANNPDLEAQINEIVDSETIALASRRSDLEAEAANIYAKAIGETDLKAIAEFYQSDAGQALLENGAIVSREVQESAGIWQRGIDRDLQENVGKKLGEIAPRNSEEKTEETETPVAE